MIYLIGFKKFKHTYFKIGVTKNLTKRLSALQTGSPFILSTFLTVELESKNNSIDYFIETNLHSLFSLYKTQSNNEWFILPSNKENHKNIEKDIKLYLESLQIKYKTYSCLNIDVEYINKTTKKKDLEKNIIIETRKLICLTAILKKYPFFKKFISLLYKEKTEEEIKEYLFNLFNI